MARPATKIEARSLIQSTTEPMRHIGPVEVYLRASDEKINKGAAICRQIATA
jgi:hypothetical protein